MKRYGDGKSPPRALLRTRDQKVLLEKASAGLYAVVSSKRFKLSAYGKTPGSALRALEHEIRLSLRTIEGDLALIRKDEREQRSEQADCHRKLSIIAAVRKMVV